MTTSDGHQADATQPVQRMPLGTVMQGEASLGQRPGDVAGEWREGIIGGKRTTGIGQPCYHLGEFGDLGERPERAKVLQFVTQAVDLGVASPELVESVVGHSAPP